MTDPTPPAYTLLPWVRRGLATQIAATPTVNYATVPLSLSVNNTPVPTPPHVRLPGPGDVKSIDARAFIRTEPRDGADNFEPNYLAAVELATPDLPWMYSPAAAAAERLQPWICLIVVPDGDGVSLVPQPGGPAVLQLSAPLDLSAVLPDLTKIDAWAHAQISGPDLPAVALQGDSGASLSRLIAPRKLEPSQKYIGCVVPTYHAGVNAGLGLDVEDNDLALAWSAATTAPFSLPVYFQFSFQTGPGGDFASLARLIGPPATPIAAGTRTMDISAAGFGAAPAPGVTLALEGALCTFHMPSTPWPAAAYETQLRGALTPPTAADPVVSPPVFGSTQTAQNLPATDTQPPIWMGELNLDPRGRVVASIGGEVVQGDADAMVASAWDQLGEIRKANQLLRQAQLARAVSASMNERHLQTVAGDGDYLQITRPVHSRVSLTLGGATATLLGHVQASRVAEGAVSAAMRKLARPRGPLGRQLAGTGPQQFVERLNLPAASGTTAMVVVAPAQPPAGMVTLDDVSPTIQMAKMTPVALHEAQGWQQATVATGVTTTDTFHPIATTGAAAVKTDDATVVPARPMLPTNPVTPTKPVVDPAKPVTDPAPPAREVAVLDWQTDPNVPAILQTAVKTLPPPLVFPTDTTALAAMQENFRGAATAVTAYLNTAEPAVTDPPSLGGSPVLSTTRTQFSARLDPAVTIQARIKARLPVGTGADPLQPLTAAPKFPQAMYEPLAALSPDWMLPGISDMPVNSAVLLQTNPRFVEAYLVGLNEEFARELLWRQFPAERTETWFQNFWYAAGTPDITPIAQFDPAGHLGDHTQDHANPGRLVLLVRANLFQRYPNALVSAAPAVWNGDKTARALGTPRQWPLFQGQIGEQYRFFGFDIPDPFGVANPTPTATNLGWYFVLEEHVTEPRFGLEPATVPPATGGPSWNDLGWDKISSGSFLDPSSAPAFTAVEPASWSQNSAAMASILMRRPVRVAMHASALVAAEQP
jgi:hypothetical protein